MQMRQDPDESRSHTFPVNMIHPFLLKVHHKLLISSGEAVLEKISGMLFVITCSFIHNDVTFYVFKPVSRDLHIMTKAIESSHVKKPSWFDVEALVIGQAHFIKDTQISTT